MDLQIRRTRAEDVDALWPCALRPVRFLQWQASTEAIDFYVGLGYHPDHEGDFAEHPKFEHEFTARSVL